MIVYTFQVFQIYILNISIYYFVDFKYIFLEFQLYISIIHFTNLKIPKANIYLIF